MACVIDFRSVKTTSEKVGNSMELYILRHGTTEWNQKHLLQGWTDIPLDEHGIQLARELGEEMQDIHFDLCYTSPLLRAKETARLALNNRDIPIIQDDRIKEMCFGKYEGMDVARSNPNIEDWLRRAISTEMEVYRTPEDGESPEDVIKRTGDFLNELLHRSDYENKRILVSTHGAASRALMNNIWGGTFWHGSIPLNCTICIVRIEHGEVKEIQQDVVLYKSEVVDWYK